jgi:hypothetical protein
VIVVRLDRKKRSFDTAKNALYARAAQLPVSMVPKKQTFQNMYFRVALQKAERANSTTSWQSAAPCHECYAISEKARKKAPHHAASRASARWSRRRHRADAGALHGKGPE